MWDRLEQIYRLGDIERLKGDPDFWEAHEVLWAVMEKAIRFGFGYQKAIRDYETHFILPLHNLRESLHCVRDEGLKGQRKSDHGYITVTEAG